MPNNTKTEFRIFLVSTSHKLIIVVCIYTDQHNLFKAMNQAQMTGQCMSGCQHEIVCESNEIRNETIKLPI